MKILIFNHFSGPFWEETRKEHSFPNQFLVLTEMCGNEILVLNTLNDKVYRVDFEGGDEDLLNGKLDEEWDGFDEFLIDYFGI